MVRDKFPDIDWTETGQPRSVHYGDVYYGKDGLAESRYVFLGGTGLYDYWRQDHIGGGQERYCLIGETGFGTGLNFLATWLHWINCGRPGRFQFLSAEKFPLDLDTLYQAHAAFPELVSLSRDLIDAFKAYGELTDGRHDFTFDEGRVGLVLLVGEADEMFAALGPDHIVDYWFLDGFAPADNPDMWSPRLLNEVARLCKPGGRLATFTAVGAVRRNLADAGFTVERKQGFGRKRHMSVGRFAKDSFKLPPHKLGWAGGGVPTVQPQSVTIIGAGLCGLLAANALRSQMPDLRIRIVDKAAGWAQITSAIPAALLTPWLDQGAGANARIMDKAFQFATGFWADLNKQGVQIWHNTGVQLLPQSEKEAAHFKALAVARNGYDLIEGALHIAQAGWIDGPAALMALAAGFDVEFGVCGNGIVPDVDHWVIYAGGAGLTGQCPEADWPIKQLAGQIVMLQNQTRLPMPEKADVYKLTHTDGRLIIGASFEDVTAAPADAPSRAVVAVRERLMTAAGVLAGDTNTISRDWRGVRAALPDRLPILGAVPDFDQWQREFSAIKNGPFAVAGRVGAFQEGAFVFGGVGSRGFMSAPFLATQLAKLMTGRLPDLSRDEVAALHPGRFLIRALKLA